MWKLIESLTIKLFALPNRLEPDYEERANIWRLKTVTILSVLTAVTVLHLAEVHGLGWGEGFASNEDVKDIQVTQIEERLDKYYKALCMRPGNEEIIALIRELQAKYEKLTGERYVPLSCDLLLTVEG